MEENYFHMQVSPQALGQISQLGLAHIGDGVFSLLVRSYLCVHGAGTNKQLHKQTVALVNAPAQAAMVETLLPLLTPQETEIYHRGRNSHTHAAPQSATPGQYARATGLETLFGWLYLQGQTDRINQLFVAGMEANHAL